MPELPEVETIRRQLAPLVEGRTLRRVAILDPRWSAPLAPGELADALTGRRVERLGRRGKYLVWSLSGDVHVAQHLRMTGTILCDPQPEPRHVRVRIELGPPAGGARPRARVATGSSRGGGRRRDSGPRLAVVDPRRFGTAQLLLGSDALEAFFDARLGLEPLDERFSAAHLRALARGRTMPVKAFVLDQRRMAGVGNIYADEALHRAGIHPLRPVGRLTAEQRERLREALRWALRAGIEARGATIDDFRHVDGVWGSFQDRFQVHRRAGEPCPRCGASIEKIVAAGRGTYVCARCQPPPRARGKRLPRGAARRDPARRDGAQGPMAAGS
jgi:formamidopyrimidine-DNA glycosylase